MNIRSPIDVKYVNFGKNNLQQRKIICVFQNCARRITGYLDGFAENMTIFGQKYLWVNCKKSPCKCKPIDI